MKETSSLPLISVITGYHNRKDGLNESVQSVLDQTYPNFEFIIFDDCSNDGTYEMLLAFNDPKLKIIRHEKNVGFTNGMIDAINQANGEFIAVHGAGDLSFPERLQKQAEDLINNPDTAISGTWYNNYNAISKTVDKVRMKLYYERDDVFLTTPISHGGAMYRKQQYTQVGGYRSVFKFVQDGELWLRLTTLGNIHVIPELLYQRNVFADGVSFNVKKTIQQAKYSLFARDINKLPLDKQQEAIDKCTKSGIDALISFDDKRIQKRLFKKFHVTLDGHDPDKLNDFVENSTGAYKLYYSFIIYSHKFKIIKTIFSFMQHSVYKPAKLKLKKLTTQ